MFDLMWGVVLKDNTQWTQYDKDGIESKFQTVLDAKDDVRLFYLVNRTLQPEKQVFYIVDLEKGCIYCAPSGCPLLEVRNDMLRKQTYNYRLIYFREVERTFDSTLKETVEAKVLFFMGFQYTDEHGYNHKRIMKIHSDGRFVIN